MNWQKVNEKVLNELPEERMEVLMIYQGRKISGTYYPLKDNDYSHVFMNSSGFWLFFHEVEWMLPMSEISDPEEQKDLTENKKLEYPSIH